MKPEYTVVCFNPRGGDCIETGSEPVATQHATLDEALRQKHFWHRPGPNGPVRSGYLYSQGRKLNPWEEIRRLGLVPLVATDFFERETLIGCATPTD